MNKKGIDDTGNRNKEASIDFTLSADDHNPIRDGQDMGCYLFRRMWFVWMLNNVIFIHTLKFMSHLRASTLQLIYP